MKGPRSAISANHHSFPHAVDSTLEAQAAGPLEPSSRKPSRSACTRRACPSCVKIAAITRRVGGRRRDGRSFRPHASIIL
eukprot:6201173-Pleurochrysis_carterae.AAC.3